MKALIYTYIQLCLSSDLILLLSSQNIKVDLTRETPSPDTANCTARHHSSRCEAPLLHHAFSAPLARYVQSSSKTKGKWRLLCLPIETCLGFPVLTVSHETSDSNAFYDEEMFCSTWKIH